MLVPILERRPRGYEADPSSFVFYISTKENKNGAGGGTNEFDVAGSHTRRLLDALGIRLKGEEAEREKRR